MDSNIPSKPAYGVFVSQLVRSLRVCDSYCQFKERSSGFVIASMFSTFLTDSTHIIIIIIIGSSDTYDVFMSASATEITKPG